MNRLTLFLVHVAIVCGGVGFMVKPISVESGIPMETVATVALFGGLVELSVISLMMFIDWRVSLWISSFEKKQITDIEDDT